MSASSTGAGSRVTARISSVQGSTLRTSMSHGCTEMYLAQHSANSRRLSRARSCLANARSYSCCMSSRIDGVSYDFGDLFGDLRHGAQRGIAGDLVDQRRRLLGDLVAGDVVPDGQHPLVTVDAQTNDSVQLVLWPSLGEERLGQDHNAEGAVGQAVVDLAAQAVPDAQLGLVEPDLEPAGTQLDGERLSDGFLVLACVGDEHVPGLAVVVGDDRRALMPDAAERRKRSGLGRRQWRWLDRGRVPDAGGLESHEVNGQVPAAGARHLDPKRCLRDQPAGVAVVPPVLVGVEVGAVHESDVGGCAQGDNNRRSLLQPITVVLEELGTCHVATSPNLLEEQSQPLGSLAGDALRHDVGRCLLWGETAGLDVAHQVV